MATGATIATAERIRVVRDEVLGAVSPWYQNGKLSRSAVSLFDNALGAALHDSLQILPADAAHEGTWSFLSLVVLPDVVVLRFPDMHEDRLVGTGRNALRRPWQRQDLLADLMQGSSRPLGEDELVGLFERTALVRNRALARRLAVAVMSYSGDEARSEWARRLYKRVTFLTGPRMLDVLDDAELDELIKSA
ncbi:hypothetical protein ACWZJV_18270 [Nocardioides sp. WG-D5]